MKKMTVVVVAVILLGLLSYAIHATVRREVTVIEVPEGVVIEEVLIEEPTSSSQQQEKDVLTVLQQETIEVEEGIITVETEIVNPQSSSANRQINTFDVSNEVEAAHETLMRLKEKAEQIENLAHKRP